MSEITTIIQTYKRPQYFSEQFNAICSQTVDSDIWVVENEGGKDFDYPDGVQLIQADPNLKFHLRFAVALIPQTKYIAIFDDDTIPQPQWFENCIEIIQEKDCLCVTAGVRMNRNLDGWSKYGWYNGNDNKLKVDFGGHAWFLRRENLKYMWMDEIENEKNGEDVMLSANLQIYGDIPTFVPPHPLNRTDLWGANPRKSAKYGSDDVAHWITKDTHLEDRLELVQKYVDKGWKLMNL